MTSPTATRAGRLAACLLLMLLAACAHAGGPADPPHGDGELAECCRDVERLPPVLVTLADPAAPLIGRTIGTIVWRHGHLRGTPATSLVAERLRPLDILLVTHKGRLSNHTLPGLLVHAAVHLGSEDELRREGLWAHPAVTPHHAAVRAGKTVIEADQHGVHLSSLASVLDSDRAAVVRPLLAGSARRREALTEFFARIGRPFDFNFDAESEDCDYCAELVSRVLPELDLPVHRAYGRALVLPDDLARKAVTGEGKLSLVLYVRVGQSGWEAASGDALAADLAAEWGAEAGPAR